MCAPGANGCGSIRARRHARANAIGDPDHVGPKKESVLPERILVWMRQIAHCWPQREALPLRILTTGYLWNESMNECVTLHALCVRACCACCARLARVCVKWICVAVWAHT